MMSVVGLLIAGEMYIHFKNKSVQGQMLAQLAAAIKPFHDGIKTAESDVQSIKQGDCDVFLSYCWKNSQLASQMNQVSNVVGGKFADPRLIKTELEKELSRSGRVNNYMNLFHNFLNKSIRLISTESGNPSKSLD